MDSASVEAEKRRIEADYDKGVLDGASALTKPLPGWYFDKTIHTLTAYERGYFFGREIAMQEVE